MYKVKVDRIKIRLDNITSRLDHIKNRVDHIKSKLRHSNLFFSWELDNVSDRFSLRYFRFLTSLIRVFLLIWSLIFHF